MLKTKLLTIVFIFFWTCSFAQDFSNLWEGHFSYNNVVDVVKGDDRIFAAAENAIFIYDPATQDLNTITTVQGLSGGEISTIYYSEEFLLLLIGYESGLIEIYSEDDNSVLSVVDILEKQNIPPNNRRINHFFENDGFIYISANFGISVYDLNRLEFGDTYFIGNSGTQITVNQTTIFNDEIFAACLDNNGLKRASLNNPNLIDFAEWETIPASSGSNFLTVNTFNNNVYTVRSNSILFEVSGSTLNQITTLASPPVDSEADSSNLIYTAVDASYIFDGSTTLINTLEPTTDFDTNFTSAVQLNNNIYISTTDFGVLTNNTLGDENYTEVKPNGPLENNIFKLDASTETVWATYGAYDEALNPDPPNSKGISFFNNNEWNSIPFENLFGTRELNTITPNIFNPNQIFICSFIDGILEVNDFEPTIQLNQSNSDLEEIDFPNRNDIRVGASKFDSGGLLWVVNSKVDRALKRYDPITNLWQSYSFSSIISDPLNGENGFFEIVIGANGTKWIGSYSNGLIAYNENLSSPIRNMNSEDQNIPPFTRFQALALDNNNQLWLGTTNGLRVLFNTFGFFDDPNPILNPIIIIEDGIPRELLDRQNIIDIKVDASNNKWIGTADAGIFYLSPDGQNTIFHFTTDNSPLPSNTINDISIDANDGTVYIATTRGLVSFRTGGSEVAETLSDAYVYPNPVRPEYNILGAPDLNDITKGIKINGLTERVNVKITDIEGNLVAEAQSGVNFRTSSNSNFAIDGGTGIWNGRNLAGNIVATGVYLIFISDLNSLETETLKVLIVR